MSGSDVPVGWETRRLSQVVLLSDSGTWGDPGSLTDGLPVLRSTNINEWELDLNADLAYRCVPERDKLRKRLQYGDIIVTKSSGSPHLIGEAALFNVRDEQTIYLFSNFTQRLRPDQSIVIPRYLHLYLKSPKAREVIGEMQRTTSGLRNLKLPDYEAQPVPLPCPDDPARSLETQRRIVARIEALFAELRECRKLHQAVVEDTNRLMDAVLAEVFDSAAVQSWPYEAQLFDLVEINAPLVDPTLPEYRNLPHINGEVIEQGSGQLLAYRTAAEDGMRSSKYLFKPGSVLYSKIRPRLRKVITVDFVGLCSADMYPLEQKAADLSKDFLKWALLSPHFTDYAVAESGRARMPKINRAELFAYRLRYPKLEEQERVAALLAAAQAERMEMKKTESEDGRLLEAMEQAILAQAFRGEL